MIANCREDAPPCTSWQKSMDASRNPVVRAMFSPTGRATSSLADPMATFEGAWAAADSCMSDVIEIARQDLKIDKTATFPRRIEEEMQEEEAGP